MDKNEEITLDTGGSNTGASEPEAPEVSQDPEVVAHSAEESEEDLPWCLQVSA